MKVTRHKETEVKREIVKKAIENGNKLIMEI